MSEEPFEVILSGGHPNSLGRTLEVVDAVLEDPERLGDLFLCYFSKDEVVRLRTSNGVKRICKEHPGWLVPYIDRLIGEIASINQASTQWTLANLFEMLRPEMREEQVAAAEAIMKHNLEHHYDWIVLNNTMQTLSDWAVEDAALKEWLLPHLERLRSDDRKSVAGRATKMLARLV